MPVRFAVDPERRRIVVEAHGVVTGEDFAGARRRLATHPGQEPGFDVLMDLSGVERLSLDPAWVRARGWAGDPSGCGEGAARIAVVACSDPGYGLARLFELSRGSDDPEAFEVFRRVDTAARWLDGHRHHAAG